MEDWESEDFEPVVTDVKKEPLKNKWDDEDVDEDDVKESWEDEDTSEKPKPQAVEKPAAKPGGKAGGKKSKGVEVKTNESKSTEINSEVLSDPLAEKLRQQRLVEEADYKSTTELFGKKSDDKTLDNFIPKSEVDFLEYAQLISYKLRPYDKSFHYTGLLKSVMRLAMVNMKAAEAKELSSSISALANEKLKAEKDAAAGKKKQGAKKKQLHVDTADDDMAVGGSYEPLDDYDFM